MCPLRELHECVLQPTALHFEPEHRDAGGHERPQHLVGHLIAIGSRAGHGLGEDDPPLAYFSPSLNAIVLFNDEANVTLRQTLFHETSHQFLERYTSDAPKWLNEGLAEYFEGWRMSPEGKLLENPRVTGRK